MRRVLIASFGFILAGAVSVGADRAAGVVLNRTGYFSAMTPNLTEHHRTNEYDVVAHISSQGIRNPAVPDAKPAGIRRILAIGDSFTFGEGVGDADTYESVLNRRLEDTGNRVNIINAGKPGASPTEERQICLAYRDRFGIDAVILTLYSDDLNQAAFRIAELSQNPAYAFVVNTWPTLTRIFRRTIGYNRWSGVHPGDTVSTVEENKIQVAEALRRNPTMLLKIPEKFRTDYLDGRINPAILTNAVRVPQQFTYLLDKKSFSFALASLQNRMRLLKSRCTESLPVYVVFIPSADQVSAHYFPFKKELGFDMDPLLVTFDIDTPLRKAVSAVGFRYYSVLPGFRADGCTTCYYPYDGHLTAEGQHRLADYIYENVVPHAK